MSNPEEISAQEALAQEFGKWLTDYYDSVLSFFKADNNARGEAAFDSWERRFLAFLKDSFPSLIDIYNKQVSGRVKVTYFGSTSLQSFLDWKGRAVDAFISQCVEDARKGHFDSYSISAEEPKVASDHHMTFVDPGRLEELSQINSPKFDIRKIIRFCEELNICYQNECYLAVAILTRALIDHVPPIFGFGTFTEVANNYAGTKSFKDQIAHLDNSSRKIADAHLHTNIRPKEILPNSTQVNFSNDIDVLLAEIIRILK